MEQKKRDEKLLEACLGLETNGVMTAPVSLILPPKPEKSAPYTKDHGFGRPGVWHGSHPGKSLTHVKKQSAPVGSISLTKPTIKLPQNIFSKT